jgi:hypothetical protein
MITISCVSETIKDTIVCNPAMSAICKSTRYILFAWAIGCAVVQCRAEVRTADSMTATLHSADIQIRVQAGRWSVAEAALLARGAFDGVELSRWPQSLETRSVADILYKQF